MAGSLVLRDVHVPPAPPLWPPAPGWWLLALLVLAGLAWWALRRLRRRRRGAEALALFDAALAARGDAAGRLAAASELLRRAARRERVDADRLQGEDWLRLLDGRGREFSTGPGRVLLDGPFRRDMDEQAAAAALALSRRRFADWMRRG